MHKARQFFDQLLEGAPAGVRAVAQEAERAASVLAQGAASRMELVTRAEFDAQAEVLAHTRSRVEQLEKRVAELAQQVERLGGSPGH